MTDTELLQICPLPDKHFWQVSIGRNHGYLYIRLMRQNRLSTKQLGSSALQMSEDMEFLVRSIKHRTHQMWAKHVATPDESALQQKAVELIRRLPGVKVVIEDD